MSSKEEHHINVLVTGVSSGIGLAIAKKLLTEDKFRVLGCARRQERMQDLQREFGERFVPYVCDVREETQILYMFEDIDRKYGGVHVLINNAGLGHKTSLIDGETSYWREMLEVNVLALSICTREALSQMRKNGDDGYIIHVSSMSAHRVPSNSGMYSATKFAVRSLTEGLRQELRQIGSNIRVSSISPGFVETEFAEKYHKSKEIAEQVYGQYFVLQPEDIAAQILFMIESPKHVQIHDILLRPTGQIS